MKTIIDRIKIILAYCIMIIRNIYSSPIMIKNVDESLDEILVSDKSLVRFGDGELSLIRGYSLRFQQYSSEIQRDLIKILSANNDNVSIAIPDNMSIKSLGQYRKKEREAWVRESVHSYKIYKKYCKNEVYLTSLVSRLYLPYAADYKKATERFKKIKMLWDKKRLLIVEGRYSRLGVGNDLFANASDIRRIICPPKDAYSEHIKIEETIIDACVENHFDLVLLSLGPTAKVVAYDLADKIRVIDIGHIDIEYEWYLKKASEKIAIKGKAVNEAEDGYKDLYMVDDEYEQEIIYTIE